MKTNRRLSFALTLLAALFYLHSSAWAQGTAFTYQGDLTAGGQPANGSFDIAFTLYNAASAGTQVGTAVTNLATGVTNGLFTVTLDFGATPYNGQALWLQIAVSPAGSNTFNALSPLQQLTSVPYAVQSLNAGTAANVTGSISLAQLPGVVLTNGETNVSITGTFSGSGSGLTNLNASQLSGTLNQAQLPSNVLTVVGLVAQANVYSSAGVTNVTVPSGATQMIVKLWGAGGGGGGDDGGGGAFVETTMAVVPGQTFTVVVGQHGDHGDDNAGGTGSSDAQGGSPSSSFGGQGGQASSLFYDTNGFYIMLAVAGGGGGGASIEPGGAGGNPGANGGAYYIGDEGSGGANGVGGNGGANSDGYGNPGDPGTNYAANATTVGIASLASAGGNGGNGGTAGEFFEYGGGGGGGYGGGGGGSGHGGGGGGGSYGQSITNGNNNVAGNNSDPNYVASAGNGGNGGNNGNDGLVVIIFPGRAGNGGGLTNLNAAQLSGTIANSQLAKSSLTVNAGTGLSGGGTVALGGAITLSNTGVTSLAAGGGVSVSAANGSVTLGSTATTAALPNSLVERDGSGNVTASNYNGNGSALTLLNATNISSGTLADARLSTNVALLNANQTFSGANSFTNARNTFAGSFTGALTGTNCVVTNNASALTSGASIDPSIFLRLFNGSKDGSFSSPDVVGLSFGQSSTRQAIVGGTYGNDYLDFYTGGVLTVPKVRIDDPGNVGIGTSTNPLSYPLQMGSGAYCSAAGVWTSVSDRNAKEDFQAITPGDVLTKVVGLPITQWKYKVEPAGLKHIGPVAQDFHAAFGLGDSDKAIGTVDESGVALAAIQGLNQKLQGVNEKLESENAELKAQLKAIQVELKELEEKQKSAP